MNLLNFKFKTMIFKNTFDDRVFITALIYENESINKRITIRKLNELIEMINENWNLNNFKDNNIAYVANILGVAILLHLLKI